jgi:hypothetical protein
MQTVEANITAMQHILNARPRTSQDDLLFGELYEVLRKHRAEDRFGITLLHKHFDLQDGEMLVEYTDQELRLQTIRVERAESVDIAQTIETAWSLEDGKIQMSCRCALQGDDHNHQHQPGVQEL